MKWTVKHYDYDIPAITDYDFFPYFEAFLLKLKKQKLTRVLIGRALQKCI